MVVKADFGHGKSLTARRLARDLAQEWLHTSEPSVTVPYPVFMKSVRDILGDYNHESPLRHALRAAAQEAVGHVESQDSDLYRLPDSEITWLLLDGLDEIAFQPNQLREMFGLLEGHTGDACRAVVFTRPGALYEGSVPKGTPVVELQSFEEVQIEDWLSRWNSLPGKADLNLDRLKTAEVAHLAQVPILLLMIALTWKEHARGEGKLDQSRLYEHFFRHIANGKHNGDTDEHVHIRQASARLLQRLQDGALQVLDDKATGIDAMLWMMSRAAWEAHRLAYNQPPQGLQQRHVTGLLVDELGVLASDAVLIRVGLLLALQFDPSGDGTTLLFGHQSFREFLVARYWKSQLVLMSHRKNQKREIERTLMPARLFQPQDKAFQFLREMLADVNDRDRDWLSEWANETFNDESLLTGDGGRFRDDRRAPLRESALAIGSELTRSLRVDPGALFSLWTWFHIQGLSLWIWAPGFKCPGGNLTGIPFNEANLEGADLNAATLSAGRLINANLNGANLANADLQHSSLHGAKLEGADLRGVNLRASLLYSTVLRRAKLTGAMHGGAILVEANLEGANLEGAIIEGANLSGANLENAKLGNASLLGTNLKDAILKGAILAGASVQSRPHTRRWHWHWAGHEQRGKTNFEGANLSGADFSNADFRTAIFSGADLSDANLSGANFQSAVLEGVRVAGAKFDQKTTWPANFSREKAIAAGATAT